jgi:hypothetical protein
MNAINLLVTMAGRGESKRLVITEPNKKGTGYGSTFESALKDMRRQQRLFVKLG